jgi:fatty acid desaturase
MRTTATITPDAESLLIKEFRAANPDLFQKSDRLLAIHLAVVLTLLGAVTFLTVWVANVPLKIVFGLVAALFWFSLVNVTIHHHHTHHNAAAGPVLTRVLDLLFYLLPSAGARKSRYVRAHMNHHARPFDDTDVDHLFGVERYLAARESPAKLVLYYLELTFVGGYIPGWTEDTYMNTVPADEWNLEDYREVMRREYGKVVAVSVAQWGAFLVTIVWLPSLVAGWGFPFAAVLITWPAWGWAFPMLLVKNWAHYLGQFQHYDATLLEPDRSIWRRTRSFRVPGWFNYLLGGEISGHFIHHLFPQIPYYKVESARRRLMRSAEVSRLFVSY